MKTKSYRVRFYSFHKYQVGKVDLSMLDDAAFDDIALEVDAQMAKEFSEFDILSVVVTCWELIEDDIRGDMYEIKAKVTVRPYR